LKKSIDHRKGKYVEAEIELQLTFCTAGQYRAIELRASKVPEPNDYGTRNWFMVPE
jgi:hypothetical protein